MTTDLKYLVFTAILTATLWILYVVCQVMTNGFLQPPNYVDPAPRPVPLWRQARRSRLSQCRRSVCALRGDGDRCAYRRQGERHDRVLGDVFLLAAGRARHRL